MPDAGKNPQFVAHLHRYASIGNSRYICMQNLSIMLASFEKEKNRKAAFVTLGVAGSMLLLFFLVKWPLPTVDPPMLTEELEVNLGSGDEGFGSDQPFLPGEPAPAIASRVV